MAVMLNLNLILYSAAAAILLATGAYFFGRLDGSTSCDLRHATEAQKQKDAIDSETTLKAKALEKKLGKLREYANGLERIVEHEIAKNHDAYACVLPDSGLQLLNAAIAAEAPSQPAN